MRTSILQNFIRSLFPHPKPESKQLFGTFEGVFLPTLLTILGAVMYLRTGWVVGNAGLLGAISIIVLANIITLCTGLSISSIATNIRVGAGGSFSIIAQSLGLEIGGSVNVPFYLAQAISVSFYIFAFTEGWLTIFPNSPASVVLFLAYAVCFVIASISVGLATKIRYPILFIVTFSLVSAFLGSTPLFRSEPLIDAQWIGTFPSGSYWQIFAIFFPAVTGVLAGVNLSGTLAKPRKSIPQGTMSAILLSFLVYILLAIWSSRVATPDELIANFSIMVDKAAFGWAIQAGILAATFSAALNSLVGAPRILQAMAEHDVVPFGAWLSELSDTGEPRNAMLLTGFIGVGTLLFGMSGNGINKIAPLMTMFFLITYAVLNAVMLLEQSMKLTSFRPSFKIPGFVPLIGLLGSIFAMFLINPTFSLIATIITIALYEYLSLRHLSTPWSDVRSGIFISLAEWAAKRVSLLPSGQERAWKPNLLVPVQSTEALRFSFRFLEALSRPNGSLHILGCHKPGEREQLENLKKYQQAFAHDGIFARIALLESIQFRLTLQTAMEVYTSAFFRPTILFLPLGIESNEEGLQHIMDHALKNELGVIIYADNPKTALGRENSINVWLREQSPDWQIGLNLPNLDLSLLIGFQLVRNWCGQMNLITVVQQEEDLPFAENYLNTLIDLGRMPKGTKIHIFVEGFEQALALAPEADLNIFGLSDKINFSFIQDMIHKTHSSCVFVHDSGKESALI